MMVKLQNYFTLESASGKKKNQQTNKQLAELSFPQDQPSINIFESRMPLK